MKKNLSFISLFLLVYNAGFSQLITDSVNRIFTLGEVTITGYKPFRDNNTVSAAKTATYNRLDVSHALNLLPGISLTGVGPRNESGVSVRGFDLRQVPVYMDGIPVYVPYDGYVDLGRFTVFDLSALQVAKGYSSVLYGPNAMGGAINLVSRKPLGRFEANAIAGWLSGGYRADFNIGSRMNKFYWQVAGSALKRDYVAMPGSFTPTKFEDGGHRNNSYSDDKKISAKIGFTPTPGQEYVLGYIYQHGKKGNPLYTGTDTLNALFKNPRYWQWPKWDKQSVYAIANNKIDSSNSIKTRLYYDQFKNDLVSYDDGSYTVISKPYAFTSIYNDYSIGGSISFNNTAIRNNVLGLAIHFKQDVHREHNVGEPIRKLSDNNMSYALEDTYRFTGKLSASAGVSYNARNSLTAQGYNSTTKQLFDYKDNDNSAWNVQGSLHYDFTAQRSLIASVAKKTRFATMKDRYSFRMGTAVPNPDLLSEAAVNYELGYHDLLFKKWGIAAAAFYSHISNTIQMVNNVQTDPVTNRPLSQLQNTGRSEYYGAELALNLKLLRQLTIDANYTFIRRNNLDNKNIRFTDVPQHKVFLALIYQPVSAAYFLVSSEYNSDRFSTSYGTVSGNFIRTDGKINYRITRNFGVETGVNNVFDRNYTLVEGYPEAGRNYFINIMFSY